MSRGSQRLTSFIAPAIAVVIWWLVTQFHLVSRLMLPTPAEVVQAAKDAGPSLAPHVLATLVRLVAGFGGGLLIGYTLGILMILVRPIRITLGPAIDSSRPAPAVATLPFFLLWFGFAPYGQILFIGLGVALIIASAVADAGRAVSPHLIRTAQTFQASRWQLARTVIMPGLLPQLAPTLRICLGIAGSLAIASEFMGADAGLGVLMELSRRTLRTENLVLFTFVLALLVSGCDIVLRLVIAHCLRWMPSSAEALDEVTPNWPRERLDKR